MAQETKHRRVTIDLDSIWELATGGILRASTFAGLGTNAARDPNLTGFELPGLLRLCYSRSAPNVEEVKAEFGRWVLASALREAVESLALALDRSYEVLLLGEWTRTAKQPTISKFRKFHRAGIEGKLEILHDEFGIQTSAAAYLRPLNKARNCLVHRMGVVGPEDCTNEEALVVRYRRMEFLAVEENGREQVLSVESGGTFRVETPARLVVRFEEEKRRFSPGSRVLFEPLEVK